MVTGVSTGSLIAPFAFLGTDHALSDIERLYETADEQFAVLKGLMFFLPWRKSFFDPKGLFATLDREVGEDIVKNILEEDNNISSETKRIVKSLIDVTLLLINRLTLNSSNSSKPPSSDTDEDKDESEDSDNI